MNGQAPLVAKEPFAAAGKTLIGCSGGNVNAPIWICGIEPGGELPSLKFKSDELDRYHYIHADFPDCKIPCWNDQFKSACLQAVAKGVKDNDYRLWRFDQNVSKLATYTCFSSDSNDDWRSNMERLYTEKGETFKLNLFPLPVPSSGDDAWTAHHGNETGFPHKALYKAWIALNRFPLYLKLAKHFQPKAIICCGSGHEQLYKMAFLGPDGMSKTQDKDHDVAHGEKQKKNIRIVNSPYGSKIFFTPFFGQGGLMANAHYKKLAELIRQETGVETIPWPKSIR